MLYSAETLGGAVLETMIEPQSMEGDRWQYAQLDLSQVSYGDATDEVFNLGGDWGQTQEFARQWVMDGRSCVLYVPAARLEGTRVVLINPAHPEFPLIRVWLENLELDTVLNPERRFGPVAAATEAQGPGVTISRWPGLVDAQGRPLNASETRLIGIETERLEDVLVAAIRDRPELVYQLGPREFEVLVATNFYQLGWDVELTAPGQDGGKDVIISKIDEAGARLCFVECKRYAPGRPVQVKIVRELYGVVETAKATAGIVVTSSSFTRGARDQAQAVAHRMSLLQYQELASKLPRPC
jgi:hypothetical protein